MTVQSTVNKITHLVSDIGQTEYIYDFRIDDASHCVVYLNDGPNPVSPGDYIVNDLGSLTGGTITISFTTALADQILILREMPLTQLLDYITYGKFPSATHEKGLDYGVMIAQQLQEAYSRAMRFPVYEDIDPELPSPLAGYILGWNDDEDAIINRPYITGDEGALIYSDHNTDGKHIVYENVTLLRATQLTPFGGQEIALLRYNPSSDGGHQFLYWDELSEETDDGISIFKINGVPVGRFKSTETALLNGEHAGCTGDGVTDESTALIRADAYFASLPNGGELVLPVGTYRVSSNVTFSKNVLVTPLPGATISSDTGVVVNFGGGFGGLTTQLSGLGSFARTENETSIAQHNAALDRMRTFEAGALTIRQTPFGFADAYQDNAGVDFGGSTNVNYDSSRTAFTPTRSQGATVFYDDLDSLASWTDLSSGTGAANIVAYGGVPDPAVGSNGVELTSGATIGGIGSIEQDIGTVPDGQFGIMYILTLEQIGVAGSDSLVITLETDANKMLQIRHRDDSIEAWADGAWQLIFAHGGDYLTEWWVNAYDVGGGEHKIDVYAGAEGVGGYTGVLPAGTLDGRLTFIQNSGASNNRISQIWVTQVGVTQLSDNLSLLSIAKEATLEPVKCRLSVLAEDLSNVIAVNTNLNAKVSLDDGVTLEEVTLVNQGVMEQGALDTSKPVYLFTANHLFTTSGDKTMRYKLVVTANQFVAFHGVDFQWE